MKTIDHIVQKFIDWYFFHFKPWIMFVSQYLGILSIYIVIALTLRSFWGIDMTTTITICILLSVGIDLWVKERIMLKRSEEIIESQFSDILIDMIIRGEDMTTATSTNFARKLQHILHQEGLLERNESGYFSESSIHKLIIIIKNKYWELKKKRTEIELAFKKKTKEIQGRHKISEDELKKKLNQLRTTAEKIRESDLINDDHPY